MPSTGVARLVLADPVLMNRFFLWSLWTAALAVLPATALMIRILAQVAIASGSIAITDWTEGEGVVALIRVVFLVSAPIGAVALSLSFFPPEGYLA